MAYQKKFEDLTWIELVRHSKKTPKSDCGQTRFMSVKKKRLMKQL